MLKQQSAAFNEVLVDGIGHTRVGRIFEGAHVMLEEGERVAPQVGKTDAMRDGK
jgi:hypothetical protein